MTYLRLVITSPLKQTTLRTFWDSASHSMKLSAEFSHTITIKLLFFDISANSTFPAPAEDTILLP